MIEISVKKTLIGTEKEIKLDINLKLERGEFVSIFGKSGSGKTTLLRVLAGLEYAEGKISVLNSKWLGKGVFLPPQKREIGFVAQDYALFENMSVLKNLLFVSKDKKFAEELLLITELSDLKDRYPNSLSGGEKQRVALCRAVMRKPKILLLDEPLSALDEKLRIKLQNKIKIIHNKLGITTIMVSHDLKEIYRLSDRIIEIEDGKIISNRKKREIFNSINKNRLKIEVLDIFNGSIFGYLNNQIVKLPLKGRDNLKVGDFIEVSIDSL